MGLGIRSEEVGQKASLSLDLEHEGSWRVFGWALNWPQHLVPDRNSTGSRMAFGVHELDKKQPMAEKISSGAVLWLLPHACSKHYSPPAWGWGKFEVLDWSCGTFHLF